jgi:methionine-rich copper-binding protein CopC
MKTLIGFLALALFSTISAYAGNVQLVESTPSNDSTLSSAPAAFVFNFSEPVRFHNLNIKKDDGKSTPIASLPTAHATSLTVKAPSLSPGHYVLDWRVFTDESTALSGRLRFTVSADGVAALTPQH